MNAPRPAVWVVGTFDTKAAEIGYLAALIRAAGVDALTVDVGTREPGASPDVSAREVAAHHPRGEAAVFEAGDRGLAVMAMSDALCEMVRRQLGLGRIAAMLGVGGSGGTSLIAPAMRLLPIGRPKLLVSTMAAGDVRAFVDVVDMTLMYPVTDIAGLNRLSRTILANAAHAVVGMVKHQAPAVTDDKPSIGLSMFGVTTPCVVAVRQRLEDRFDAQVFHANGSGGRTLEALAAAGMLRAVVDVTTTEVGQNLAGGVCDAGPDRLACAARHHLPWIGSLGALDMINWGPMDTVPERHRGRRFHVHNAQVTLMRSSPEEAAAAGRRIAERLGESDGPVRLLVPEGGLSMLDAPGQPFHDPVADAALFDAIERHWLPRDGHELVRLPYHINDPAFADAVARTVREVLGVAG